VGAEELKNVDYEINLNDSWMPFNYEDDPSITVFYQGVIGEGTHTNNEKSIQKISSYIVAKFNESYNSYDLLEVSFDIEPLINNESLRNTLFKRNETGILSLIDSDENRHDYNVTIKPGKIIEVILDDSTTAAIASLVQEHDTFKTTIRGNKGDWLCEFSLVGYWDSPDYAGSIYAGSMVVARGIAALGPVIRLGTRLLPKILKVAKQLVTKIKGKIRAKKPPIRPPVYYPDQAKTYVIDKIYPQMQKEFNNSINNRFTRLRTREEWKYLISLTLNEIHHNIPPELLDDYIDHWVDDIKDMRL
jgi:hypothetical protein